MACSGPAAAPSAPAPASQADEIFSALLPLTAAYEAHTFGWSPGEALPPMVVDLDGLCEQFGGAKDFVIDILEEYMQDASASVAQMTTGWREFLEAPFGSQQSSKALSSTKSAAHGLKGTSGNLRFMPLMWAAALLQRNLEDLILVAEGQHPKQQQHDAIVSELTRLVAVMQRQFAMIVEGFAAYKA